MHEHTHQSIRHLHACKGIDGMLNRNLQFCHTCPASTNIIWYFSSESIVTCPPDKLKMFSDMIKSINKRSDKQEG